VSSGPEDESAATVAYRRGDGRETGVVHAIGMALLEGTIYEGANQLNGHLLDYKLQTAADSPPINVEFVESCAPGLAGNLCRGTGYQKIFRAVRRAAAGD
jgi:hypothetical protein